MQQDFAERQEQRADGRGRGSKRLGVQGLEKFREV